jgi:hypothetical protein
MPYTVLACRCLLGVVFLVAAFTKLHSRDNFRAFASWLDGVPLLPGRHRMTVAVTMAVTEAVIVVAVALPWTSMAGLLLAAATLAVFAAGAFVVGRRQPGVPCSCFGASGTPLTTRHVVRNAALCAVAAAGAAAAARSGTNLGPADPAGIALSLWAAVTAAMITIFLDDLAVFRTGRQPVGGRPAS